MQQETIQSLLLIGLSFLLIYLSSTQIKFTFLIFIRFIEVLMADILIQPILQLIFEFLSVADFDDRVFFGTDNNRLIKSEDQGITFSIVDTSDIQTVLPGLAFYYDVNQFHIYRLNRSNGKFTLNVSNNKGEAFSWTKTYESDTQFFITIDSTQSGVVYLADGRKIYKSTNNGFTFIIQIVTK